MSDARKHNCTDAAGHQSRFLTFCSVLLPVVFCLIVVPLDIYSANAAEYRNDLHVLYSFGKAALVFVVVALISVLALPQVARELLARLSIAAGFSAILFDMATPMISVTPGVSFELPKNVSLVTASFELLAVLMILVICFKAPRALLEKFAAIFMLALVVQQIWLGKRFVQNNYEERAETIHLNNEAFDNKSLPNVYHVILDGFAGDMFLPLLKEMGLEEKFGGFVHYPKNLANYGRTHESVPSLLTGTLAPRENVGAWTKSYPQTGILPTLKNAGYSINLFVTGFYNEPTQADLTFGLFDLRNRALNRARKEDFYKIWFLRISPQILVHFMIDGRIDELLVSNREDLPIRGDAYDVFLSLDLMKEYIRFVESQSGGGHYNFVHTMIPHSPYIWDQDCNLADKVILVSDDANKRAAYTSQSKCSIRLLTQLLDLLKQKAEFDNAIIIIHSDHGEYFERETIESSVDDSTNRKITEVDLLRFTGRNVEARQRALLLVKPRRTSGDRLKISNRQTQLLDVYPTITGLIGRAPDSSAGVNVLAREFPQNRRIDIFHGFTQRAQNGTEVLRFGSTLFEGDVNHYSYSVDSAWSVHDNVHIVWGD